MVCCTTCDVKLAYISKAISPFSVTVGQMIQLKTIYNEMLFVLLSDFDRLSLSLYRVERSCVHSNACRAS